jgi:hypothetical protein
MVSQSRSLTGIPTGTGRWSGHGDMPLENRRSGKPLFKTPRVEAERLAKVHRKMN